MKKAAVFISLIFSLGSAYSDVANKTTFVLDGYFDFLEKELKVDIKNYYESYVQAYSHPEKITVPILEKFMYNGISRVAGPFSVSFRPKLGQNITVEVSSEAKMYIDLREGGKYGKKISQSDTSLNFLVEKDMDYTLTFVPEYAKVGTATLKINSRPSLPFPLKGKSKNDIKSHYGDRRSNGRSHEGVDIFTARHSIAYAVKDALVVDSSTNPLGGYVVSLLDDEGYYYYYAHLGNQLVKVGDRVKTGDPVAMTSNTGDAITTPTHLHFGIYKQSWKNPMNPYYFISEVGSAKRNFVEKYIGKRVYIRGVRGKPLVIFETEKDVGFFNPYPNIVRALKTKIRRSP